MKRVRVRVSFDVWVELPDECDETFVIEENGCPGTGSVGLAVDELVHAQETSDVCLMCRAKGENKIVEVVSVNESPRGDVVGR